MLSVNERLTGFNGEFQQILSSITKSIELCSTKRDTAIIAATFTFPPSTFTFTTPSLTLIETSVKARKHKENR